MKHKINKYTLFAEGNKKGFFWLEQYSKNEQTDEMGRWARVCFYNGFIICWITGFVKVKGKLTDNREVGTCNMFVANLKFPTSANEADGSAIFDTIAEAKQYTEEMFNDFKNLINN